MSIRSGFNFCWVMRSSTFSWRAGICVAAVARSRAPFLLPTTQVVEQPKRLKRESVITVIQLIFITVPYFLYARSNDLKIVDFTLRKVKRVIV